MDTFITTTYVICDELLKLLDIHDNPQSLMSHAEVMTFGIISAQLFSSNHRKARYLSKQLNLFPHILSNSRLNRRMHSISWNVWYAVFRFISFIFLKVDHQKEYAVDSFPVAFCQKSRIDRRKIFLQKEYFGYAASKKRHFCGIRVHMLVSCTGHPVEVQLLPAAVADVNVVWHLELDIPSMSKIYADGAYNCFELEDTLADELILLIAKRGKGTKNRLRNPDEEKVISSKRQIVETVFSCITEILPRYIRARTEHGFMLKVFCCVLAYSVHCLCKIPLG